MSDFLEARKAAIKIQKDSGIYVTKRQTIMDRQSSINFDIAGQLNQAMEQAQREDIEHEPRSTVLKMLQSTKFDEPFVFKVAARTADDYIQAMRMVLSRTRAKAHKQKKKLSDFKMMRVEVVENDDHDLVTLLRTKTLSDHQASVYDDLIGALAQNTEE